MRLLLYGMQSSGASILAFTFAQRPDSLAYVDIWNTYAAPEISSFDGDIVAKVVVTTAFSLEAHRRRFRPDVTILALRHPGDTFDSLFGKPYANDNGLMDEKFSVVERVFREGRGFDHLFHYEDFAFCPDKVIDQCNSVGWKIDIHALLFARSHQEIQDANIASCPEIERRLQYGPGNIQPHALLRGRARFSQPWGKTAHLPQICPSLFEHYTAMRADRGDLWHVPTAAILSCQLHAVLRELTYSGPIPRRSERSGYKLEFTGGTPQCRIGDAEIVLHPGARKSGTRLTVSGLPGYPLNRIRGVVYVEHPLARGTTVHLQLRGAAGRCMAEQSFTLCHGAMRNLDVSFDSEERLTLSIGVRLSAGVDSDAHSSVLIRELRLEQVPTY
jgi:hypothetical protein